MAQVFNFQKKTEKSLGNTMAVKFDVNRKKKSKKITGPSAQHYYWRGEGNGSRLAGVLLQRLWKVFSQRC